MEARYGRRLVVAILGVCFLSVNATLATEPRLGNLRTKNFVVTAPTQELASQIGFAAEKYRRELAREWLGREIPDWPQPCVITAYLKPQAFGETSFSFAGQRGKPSRPFDFVMQLNGSRERILDSVLPHEVSHTIFATHFGQPLPRWADEGACTTVEHISERRKNHQMLIEFLTTGRGIPFNKMFVMKQYPRDILPLYAQGYSLCRFLIQRGGKRKFIKFMGEGMERSDWGSAVSNHYKIKDLSGLQVQWLKWVKEGCPNPRQQLVADERNEYLANANRSKFDEEPSVAVAPNDGPIKQVPIDSPLVEPNSNQSSSSTSEQKRITSSSSSENFYLREIERAKSGTLFR